MSRAVRMLILLSCLGGSIAFLLAKPGDVIDKALLWERVEDPPRLCTAGPGTRTAWTVRARAGGDADVEAATRAHLGRIGCAFDCNARGEVEVVPRWGERPGFFSGLGTMSVDLAVWWSAGECRRASRWRLEAEIDQGRRGTEARMVRDVGRAVAEFVMDPRGDGP